MENVIREIAEELEAQKIVIEEVLDLALRNQATLQAITEILIKEQITDEQELAILQQDNLNMIEYLIEKD